MSQALFDAAKRGDLAEVERLLELPETNINFIGTIEGYQYTPTTIAIGKGHVKIATLLIKKGGNVTNKMIAECNFSEFHLNALTSIADCIVNNKKIAVDLNLLKMIVERADYLDLYLYPYSSNLLSYFKKNKVSDAVLKLFYFEAILRNDCKVMEQLLSLQFSVSDFLRYIADRKFTTASLDDLQSSLAYLAGKSICQSHSVSLILDTVKKELMAGGQLLTSTRSREELFCELAPYFNPKLNLPVMPIDYQIAQGWSIPDATISIEAIRALQDIRNLRAIVTMDEASFFKIMCSVERLTTKDNPVYQLLSELVARFADSEIIENGIGCLLLNAEQKALAFQRLNTFALMSLSDKVNFQTKYMLENEMVDLKENNAQLKGDIENLQDENKQLQAKLTALSAQQNEMQKQIDMLLALQQQKTAQPQKGPGLFN